MPISRPVEPVITPDDRSNSPPIISSATATAMMPSVDATSVQRAMPLSVANCSAVTAKNRNTAPAPIIAPSSGRWSSLVRNETFASRSSSAVSGGSDVGWSALCSSRAGLRQLLDLRGVGLLDEARPGEDELPPPTVLRLVLLSVRKTTGR